MALQLSAALAYFELTLEVQVHIGLPIVSQTYLRNKPYPALYTSSLTMSYLSFVSAVVYYLLYPIFLLLQAILTILLFLAAPFIHLVHYIAYACWWPFHILAKFEVSQL